MSRAKTQVRAKTRPIRAIAAVGAFLCALLLCSAAGCDDRTPVLAGTPTPSPSPTPVPSPFTASVTGAPFSTDALGLAIEGADHYDYYLSFGDLRVYEYENGTFLDGIIVNGYPESLDGVIEIVYYDAEGKLCGRGELHNAAGGTVLKSGSNAVYAEISTDIDVQMLDAQYVITTSFMPVQDDTP